MSIKSLLLSVFLAAFFLSIVQSAEATWVHAYIHRADGVPVPGATVRITNQSTGGSFIFQGPTDASGWLHVDLNLQWNNTYLVDPLVGTCPRAQDFTFNGWNRYFYFVLQSYKQPCY